MDLAADLSVVFEIQDRIKRALHSKQTLTIRAGGSKDFYGCAGQSEVLDVSYNQGIVAYEPSELVLTVRAGTSLKEIEQLLSENGQMLGFEPPAYGVNATIGGTVACNFSGPRRAYQYSVRDAILGVKMINGKSETLTFGGQVMKNVAGFDVSRLMAGSMGTLGVLLDISLRVDPLPEEENTLVFQLTPEKALKQLQQWSSKPLPISGSCLVDNKLYIRLSGAEKALSQVNSQLGGELLSETEAKAFWTSIKEQTHRFFSNDNRCLWRHSVAPNAPISTNEKETLYEWGGALRWIKTDRHEPEKKDFKLSNGSRCIFRCSDENRHVFQPLPPSMLALHKRLKQAFDPKGIFNIGRMYPEF